MNTIKSELVLMFLLVLIYCCQSVSISNHFFLSSSISPFGVPSIRFATNLSRKHIKEGAKTDTICNNVMHTYLLKPMKSPKAIITNMIMYSL